LAAGSAVRVVFLTHGEASREARTYVRPSKPALGIGQAVGRMRREEAQKAVAQLGLAPEQVLFLGYPDGGTLDIWKCHWGRSAPLYCQVTETDTVPYEEAPTYGQPYKGEAVLAALIGQLLAFRPTRVVVSHLEDEHGDHQACALFLMAALLETAGDLPAPQVLGYPTHSRHWPAALGEHPDFWLPVPPKMADSPYPWRCLELSAAEISVKNQTLRLYPDQMGESRQQLLSLVRRNEIFAELSASPLHREATAAAERAGRVGCRDVGDALAVDVPLPAPAKGIAGLSVCVFGHRRDRPFAQMPKIRVIWKEEHLSVFDQGSALSAAPIRLLRTSDELTVLIPWDILGGPETLFVQGGALGDGSPNRQPGWLILRRGT
jgi:LmbE family N-acetylglucosaminyl deacetylase